MYTVTSFSNNTAFNLTNELTTNTKLSLANRTPLKLYIWDLSKLIIVY